MTQILIADDEASIRTILSRVMEKKGFDVIRAKTGKQALDYLKGRPIDIALIDIRMPEMSGLDILGYQKEFPSNPFIIVITAQDTMENAVEAMKRGAYDYLTKPFDLDELSLLVDRAVETRRLQQEVKVLKQSSPVQTNTSLTIIGKSRAIQEVYKVIGRVANQDVTVLLQGESGTGKELVARAIHYQGSRADSPFVAVNCSAIPSNLLESELFGYKKGAFTGAVADKSGYVERANTGTLFLDEVGDMPLDLQAKLLRVLEDKKIQRLGDTRTISFDVRFIAATNQNLKKKVQKGEFREDLFFRLNVVPMNLPPLRERKNDIPILVDFFLHRFAKEFGCEPKRLSEKALVYLEKQEWKGNVRELENLLKRVFVLNPGLVLEARDFENLSSGLLKSTLPQGADVTQLEEFISDNLKSYFSDISADRENDLYHSLLPLLERPLIRLALRKTKGNQLKAARLLGINRNTLRKKIRELEI